MQHTASRLERAALTVPTSEAVAAAWERLRPVSFDPRRLARARIVTVDKTRSRHMPFDMMRTRIVSMLHRRNWRTIMVTSPTPGCGKTTTCLNLAFSFARRTEGRVLVAEFDLVKPAMAAMLGITPPSSIGDLLRGDAAVEDVFLRWGDRLAIGLAKGRSRHSAEALLSSGCADALLRTHRVLDPDVVFYDLPPVFAVDDAVAFAPKADCALVVAAEGESGLDEIDACMTQLASVTEVLGVILNKSVFPSRSAYGYYGYKYDY
jgi:Mrp family chromosome partitioning ATPase